MICKRFCVIGKVQGVFFRDTTRSVAQKLELTGWCRNLPDGSVEVCACGDEVALNQLFSWLHSGPPRARVTRVESCLVEMEPPPGFQIRFS